MDQFERAQARAERRLEKKGIDLNALEKTAQRSILHLPVKTPKPTKKKYERSDEIGISIWVFDNRYDMQFKAPITTSVIGSQLSREGMESLMTELLSKAFGRVTKL